MDIFIYSDESGVFDVVHNRYFVFGGLMFLGREARDICARKYSKAENDVRAANNLPRSVEVKASNVSNSSKGKLFRSLNNQIRFGVVIDAKKILKSIWADKKDKQRYLDYVYKIAVKRCFEWLIKQGRINANEVEHLHFFVDEHTTATNRRYELREALEQELKNGTYNYTWEHFFPPTFPSVRSVELAFCNSSTKTLVRAADVVANRIYHCAQTIENYTAADDDLFVIRLP